MLRAKYCVRRESIKAIVVYYTSMQRLTLVQAVNAATHRQLCIACQGVQMAAALQ